jgi:hypothetical protein
MKWAAIFVVVSIVAVFYLMGDKPDYDEEPSSEEQTIRYQDDSYDEFEEDRGNDPSWQNKRANKIMPLGSNLD